jgi:hypothetical protein
VARCARFQGPCGYFVDTGVNDYQNLAALVTATADYQNLAALVTATAMAKLT